jgi:hypothetical protein
VDALEREYVRRRGRPGVKLKFDVDAEIQEVRWDVGLNDEQ